MPQGSIHVLHVVPGLMPGGMETAMARVILGLDRPDIRHSIACLKGEAIIRDQLPPSADVHCLRSRPNEPTLPWRLWRLILRVRPTVIHARNWGAWPDVALARLGMWPAVPLVFSFHGFARPDWVPLRRRLAFRLLARITTSLFTVSEPTRRMLIEQMGWPEGKVDVIPNGADTERFAPVRPHSDGPLVIGTVGSLTPVKNQSLLIRACAGLSSRGIDWRLRIAGQGPMRPGLEELAKSLGVADRLELTGHVSDVPGFLHGLHVFVLPSDSEGHPNALIEAMACGLACVATRVGGVEAVLDGGRAGRLVEQSNLPALTQALAELAGDPGRRADLGAAAREQVCRHYSMAAMLESYERLYRRVSRDRFGRWGRREPRGRPPRPRVLMLGPLPPLTGGMATVAENLCVSSLAHSCRLTVINNGKLTPAGRSLIRGIGAQLSLFGRVIGAVLNDRVQIVHIHTCAMFSFWRDILHAAACRMLGVKVVWHIHDGSFVPFLAGQPPLQRCIIRKALKMGSRVIVLSRLSEDGLRPLAPEVNWCVVPNGVPVPIQPASPSEGRFCLLFLGNLTRRKGAYDLVDAMAAAALNGLPVVARLAGGETLTGQREELLDHVEQLGIADRIELLGVVSGSAKDHALADSHCLVLPSYAEGLPMAVLEGMAYGLPVIATRVGAIPEVITDGGEGFLIAPGDVAALADRIARLVRQPELRRRMGRAARRRAQAIYSLDGMAENVVGLYRRILALAELREKR